MDLNFLAKKDQELRERWFKKVGFIRDGFSKNIEDPDVFVTQEDSMERIVNAILTGSNNVLTTGPIGIGKTMPLKQIKRQFGNDYNIIYLPPRPFTPSVLLDYLTGEVGAGIRRRKRGLLARILNLGKKKEVNSLDGLIQGMKESYKKNKKRWVIMVDEYGYHSPDTLKVVKAITDEVLDTNESFSIMILAGTPEHEGALEKTYPEITRRCVCVYMKPMDRVQAFEFVARRICYSKGKIYQEKEDAIEQLKPFTPDDVNRIIDGCWTIVDYGKGERYPGVIPRELRMACNEVVWNLVKS